MSTYTTDQYVRAQQRGDIAVRVPFIEGRMTCDGVEMILLRSAAHTNRDVESAKYWLRNERDVTRFIVRTPEVIKRGTK